MKRTVIVIGSILLAVGAAGFRVAGHTAPQVVPVSLAPVVLWSLEAQRAIVPPPAGVGDRFPGDAAVYMAIVRGHV